MDARLSGWSAAPIVEMLIPSTLDDSLAPPGRHVASLFCQHVAPKLPDGRSWDEARETVADLMIDTVEAYAPGFKASVIARQILSPLDLEREFGLVGGDIFHGKLSLDQLYSARPVLGHADYRSPIPGLYMCGASTHPGGGVTGAPGHNAAREMIRDFRRRRVPALFLRRRHGARPLPDRDGGKLTCPRFSALSLRTFLPHGPRRPQRRGRVRLGSSRNGPENSCAFGGTSTSSPRSSASRRLLEGADDSEPRHHRRKLEGRSPRRSAARPPSLAPSRHRVRTADR